MLFSNILQYEAIVVYDFGGTGSKDINFEPMRSDLKCNYSSSGDGVGDKEGNRVALLERWKENQTFFKILDPV